MKENIYINFQDKETTKKIKWLLAGTSKDPARSILNGFHIKNGKSQAADGFCMHEIETPEVLNEYNGQTLKPVNNITIKPQVQELEKIEGNFPNCDFLEEEKPIEYTFHVDAARLANTLKDFPGDGLVTITLTKSTNPIKIKSDIATAYLMPMRKD